jgi:hypothetical protein
MTKPHDIKINEQQESDLFDMAVEGIANARKFDFAVMDDAQNLHIYDVIQGRSIVLKHNGT